MAKAAPNYTLDGSLERIAEADTEYVCSDEPANFAGIAAVALAEASMTPGHGNDFTIGDGDVSGRKVAVAQKSNATIDATGTATHVVLADAANSRLIYVTTCTSQALTMGGTVTIPSWSVEIRDPT